MNFKISDSITWVGKIDWELRKFHGEEYSTHRGSSYNAYLVQAEKTVLIDTVWLPFAKEFVSNLRQTIDLEKIDANDSFGQHFASAMMYNDLVDQAELHQEAMKYYANILTPLGKLVDRKIKEVVGFNLPVDMIAPAHGIIWRDNPLQMSGPRIIRKIR